MTGNNTDLGMGYSYRFIGWHPDRELNPQYDGIADLEKSMLLLTCPHGDGGIHLDHGEPYNTLFRRHVWQVESWEPLTLSPSILRRECGCHGFIRQGKWVPA